MSYIGHFEHDWESYKKAPKWENRFKVAAVGVGYSSVERHGQTPLNRLALDAAKDAVRDAGLTMDQIDGVGTFPNLPASGHPTVEGITEVGIHSFLTVMNPKPGQMKWLMQNSIGNIGATVQFAAQALMMGNCDYAVVYRAMHNPVGTYQNLPVGSAGGGQQWTAPWGFGGPGQGMAVEYTRYLEQNNQKREKMGTLSVQQRKYANKNPHAHFHNQQLTMDDYLHSRMVAWPFCLYDCDIPVQAAVAMVLTRADVAKTLKNPPAYLAGFGQRTSFETGGVGNLADYMEGGWSSSKNTWRLSGLTPKDIQVAQMYDGFSASAIYGLESYGFAKEGQALDFIQNGTLSPTGQLPMNTFGGSLSAGRLHGLWHVIEAVLQAQGRSDNQIPGINVSFAGSSAPIVQASTSIWVHDPY